MSLGSQARIALAAARERLLVAVAAAAPSEAKVLRTNLRADPAMVDPVTYSELVAGDVMRNLYEGFTEIDKDGSIMPALAVRWEANPDNKGFRFHLRKGVKFHSGREFTAKDVKWTFEQILLPGNKGGLTLVYLKVLEGAQEIQDGKATQLSGVKVVDPYTLDVRFTRPDVLFPIYPFQFMDSGIVAQHGADWHTKVSAGTGPFKFVHWKRGQEVRLAAHKDYWGGAPTVDDVAMLDRAELRHRGLDVRGQRARRGGSRSRSRRRRVLKDPKFKDEILAVPAAQIRYLGMNQNLYAPFKDKRVREAICLSFDREGLVKGLYGGAGAPLYGQITPGVAGYNPNVKPHPVRPGAGQEADGRGRLPGRQGPAAAEDHLRAELQGRARLLRRPVQEGARHAGRDRDPGARDVHQADERRRGAVLPLGLDRRLPGRAVLPVAGLVRPEPVQPGPLEERRVRPADRPGAGHAPTRRRATGSTTRRSRCCSTDWGTCPLVVRMQIALRKPNVQGVRLTPFRFLPFNTVDDQLIATRAARPRRERPPVSVVRASPRARPAAGPAAAVVLTFVANQFVPGDPIMMLLSDHSGDVALAAQAPRRVRPRPAVAGAVRRLRGRHRCAATSASRSASPSTPVIDVIARRARGQPAPRRRRAADRGPPRRRPRRRSPRSGGTRSRTRSSSSSWSPDCRSRTSPSPRSSSTLLSSSSGGCRSPAGATRAGGPAGPAPRHPAAAYIARLARTFMLEVLQQDYIRTARAKGLAGGSSSAATRCATRCVPLLTTVGIILGGLLTGTFVVETIFNIPGLGRIAIQSIFARDYPVTMAIVLLFTFFYVGHQPRGRPPLRRRSTRGSAGPAGGARVSGAGDAAAALEALAAGARSDFCARFLRSRNARARRSAHRARRRWRRSRRRCSRPTGTTTPTSWRSGRALAGGPRSAPTSSAATS